MPPSEQPRVFISYARKDGAALAQRLQKDLKEQGFDAWLDTQRILGGAVWGMELDEAIDSRQVVIALLSPASYISEICRAEQLRALDKGKRVIPVVAIKGAERPTYLYAKEYRDFTDDANYAARLTELLADIRGDTTATLPDAYRKTHVTYLTAPPRVANYLERPEALHALRDALFAEDQRQPIALTALHGMGGIGKTVLAKALTDDEVVRRAFPDGIVWITAGKEQKRDFIEEMREVAKALGDDLSGYDTALACENQYRTTIASKAALIVVDDVWSKSDIEPLLAESPRSRFLFTTRDAAIGNLVGARDHRADLLDDAQSRELLALWANTPFAQLPAVADDIIHECGRLPLALSVLGGMLRGKNAQYWVDTLARLRKADLSSFQKQLPTGQETFFKAVETSFRSLEPQMQEQYKALAVLLEDMAVPQPILETLWNLDNADARLVSNRLVELSLAQFEGATESIRLHDLQLDYVRAQFQDKEALNLIHGAIRLSSHVIARDPEQFASQMAGRLLPYSGGRPPVDAIIKRAAEGTRTPWLRALQPTLAPPGTGLVRTLTGHTNNISGVALSGQGRVAVSASSDKTLKVWDLATGQELRSLKGHVAGVTSVALSEDGRLAVSASHDRTLKVWELDGGRELRTLTGHTGSVVGVAVTADGQRAVSASSDQTLKVWELDSGRELRTLEGHSDRVSDVAMTADGNRAISASDDNTLKVWELDGGRELRSLAGHRGSVFAVAVTADGKRAVSASYDKTLKVWDLESGRELCTLTGHSSSVSAVALTADLKRAVSASYDKTLKVWDLESGRELCTLTGHSNWVTAVALTPDGRSVISASSDKTLKDWDLESVRGRRTLTGHSGWVNAVAADRKRAVSASYDYTLKVWDLESGRELCTLTGHSNWVTAVALTPDGRSVISASSDKTLKDWDLESVRGRRTLTGHSGWVNAVAADRKRAVSASYDYTLKVWDLESGRELCTLTGHSNWVTAVALTPDGQRVVSASCDKTLKVWDLESGRELRTLTGHKVPVFAVAVTLDGRLVVSGSQDQTLKVWDLESGRELRTLTGHADGVGAVAVTGDGQRTISASHDKTLKVWDLESGRELRTLTGHTKPVRAVAVTGDGTRAVSASYDKTLKVWDLESGREQRTLTGHSDTVYAVAVTADGTRAVSASADNTVKLWDLRSGDVLATFTCDAVARCCTFSEALRLIIAGDAGGHVHFLRLEEPKAKG